MLLKQVVTKKMPQSRRRDGRNDLHPRHPYMYTKSDRHNTKQLAGKTDEAETFMLAH